MNTEAPTESKTKTTTATVPVESTTQTTSSIPDQYSSEEISAMFSAYIAENPDPNRNYENADYGYALIDLNNDGVQELLITYDEVEAGSPGVTGIFNINNNSLESIWIQCTRQYIIDPWIKSHRLNADSSDEKGRKGNAEAGWYYVETDKILKNRVPFDAQGYSKHSIKNYFDNSTLKFTSIE